MGICGSHRVGIEEYKEKNIDDIFLDRFREQWMIDAFRIIRINKINKKCALNILANINIDTRLIKKYKLYELFNWGEPRYVDSLIFLNSSVDIKFYFDFCKIKTLDSTFENDITENLISNGKTVDWEFIKKYEFAWNLRTLSKAVNMDWNFVLKKYFNSWKYTHWDWTELSKNKTLTWKFIKKYPKLPWNWFYISSHNCVTFDTIIKNLKKYPWNIRGISINPNITINIVMNNMSFGWNWGALFYNNSIKWRYRDIEILRDKYEDLSFNDIYENLSEKFVKIYMKKYPTEHEALFWTCHNTNISTKFIEKIIEKYINNVIFVAFFSKHPSLTWEFVSKHVEWNWNWSHLIENKHVTIPFKIINSLEHISDYDRINYFTFNNLTYHDFKDSLNNNYMWNTDMIYALCQSSNFLTWKIVANTKFHWNYEKLLLNKMGFPYRKKRGLCKQIFFFKLLRHLTSISKYTSYWLLMNYVL